MTTTENTITVQFPVRPGARGRVIDPSVTEFVADVNLPALPEIGTEITAVMVLPVTGPPGPDSLGFRLSPVGNGTYVWKVIDSPWHRGRSADHNHHNLARYEDSFRIQGFDAETGESVNRFADIKVWIEDARYAKAEA